MIGRPARPLLLAVALALAACAGGASRRAEAPAALPLPKVAPAALVPFAAEQRLRVEVTAAAPAAPSPPPTAVDALLVVEPGQLHLALLLAGRRVLDLRWDGTTLTEQRAAEVPAAIASERIARDVLVAYAPLEALRSVLPPDDRIDEAVDADGGRERRWSRGGVVQLSVRYHAEPAWAGALELDNRAEHYRLAISSRPLPPEPR